LITNKRDRVTLERPLIGWCEWVELPQLGLPYIKAKVDTGARTSALHAESIETFSKKGHPWVRFTIKPLPSAKQLVVTCEAPLIDRRMVKDSGGKSEKRYVIETLVNLDGVSRFVEVTLTNREKMVFRMLLGRQAITKLNYHVDPAHQCLRAKIKKEMARKAYRG
jgi:ribosomal protein S6--L-glutamate ligase